MPQRISPSKLAAEFLVIFVSVILALLADDWRANHLLIKEERRVLETMVKDLQADMVNLTFFGRELADIEESTTLALEALLAEDAPDHETFASRAMRGTTLWLYRPTYPT